MSAATGQEIWANVGPIRFVHKHVQQHSCRPRRDRSGSSRSSIGRGPCYVAFLFFVTPRSGGRLAPGYHSSSNPLVCSILTSWHPAIHLVDKRQVERLFFVEGAHRLAAIGATAVFRASLVVGGLVGPLRAPSRVGATAGI